MPAPACPNADQCPILPMLEMHALHELKSSYCDGKFERCERIRRSLDRRIVPMNLLPDGKTLGAETTQRAPASPAAQRAPASPAQRAPASPAQRAPASPAGPARRD